MKMIGEMKAYSFEEIQDEIIGPIGTPERDEYEREITEELQAPAATTVTRLAAVPVCPTKCKIYEQDFRSADG